MKDAQASARRERGVDSTRNLHPDFDALRALAQGTPRYEVWAPSGGQVIRFRSYCTLDEATAAAAVLVEAGCPANVVKVDL